MEHFSIPQAMKFRINLGYRNHYTKYTKTISRQRLLLQQLIICVDNPVKNYSGELLL